MGKLSGTGGAINLASGILTVNSSGNIDAGRRRSPAPAASPRQGSGTLNLTGANTYTGATR